MTRAPQPPVGHVITTVRMVDGRVKLELGVSAPAVSAKRKRCESAADIFRQRWGEPMKSLFPMEVE